MTEATLSRDVGALRPSPSERPITSVLRSLDIDTRLIGMIVALAIIWIGFQVMSGGLFLTPRNLWNLSVQSSSIAIMATGMVLVIVSRNIDLSVGSMLGFSSDISAPAVCRNRRSFRFAACGGLYCVCESKHSAD